MKRIKSPVEGWRIWRIEETRRGPRLTSVNAGVGWKTVVWQPRAAEPAVCTALNVTHSTPAPRRGCRCGYYAADGIPGLVADAMGPGWRGSSFCVMGRVALWGRTIRHAYGYRAEFAQPLCLVPPFSSEVSGLIDQLVAIYEIAIEATPPLEMPGGRFVVVRYEAKADDRTAQQLVCRGCVGQLDLPYSGVLWALPVALTRVLIQRCYVCGKIVKR